MKTSTKAESCNLSADCVHLTLVQNSVLASSWKDSELHENLASVSTRSCVQAGLPSVWAVKYTLFCCVAVEKEFGKTNHEKIHKWARRSSKPNLVSCFHQYERNVSLPFSWSKLFFSMHSWDKNNLNLSYCLILSSDILNRSAGPYDCALSPHNFVFGPFKEGWVFRSPHQPLQAGPYSATYYQLSSTSHSKAAVIHHLLGK